MDGGTLDEKLRDGLERIGQVIRFLLREKAKRWGLTPLQAQILLLVRARPEDREGLSALAQTLQVRPSTLSDAVQALVRKGYLSRRPHPENRRSGILRLTPGGVQVADDLAEWGGPLLEGMKSLPFTQKEQVWLFLLSLIGDLVRQGVIGAARMCFHCSYFERKAGEEPPYFCHYLQEGLSPHQLRLECPDYRPVEEATAGRR